MARYSAWDGGPLDDGDEDEDVARQEREDAYEEAWWAAVMADEPAILALVTA